MYVGAWALHWAALQRFIDSTALCCSARGRCETGRQRCTSITITYKILASANSRCAEGQCAQGCLQLASEHAPPTELPLAALVTAVRDAMIKWGIQIIRGVYQHPQLAQQTITASRVVCLCPLLSPIHIPAPTRLIRCADGGSCLKK